MSRVTVALDPPYEVIVQPGALGEVGRVLSDRRQVAVVHPASLPAAWCDAVRDALASAAVPATWHPVPDGEAAKSLETVRALCSAFAGEGLLRGDAVVALGGGMVGDTAGFAAAIYHRGVAVVQAPTTLLAQVDAAIGGKTAVNLPEGKNLVGAFHQPIAVLADTRTLSTLPDAELRGGLGEVAKYALLHPAADDPSGLAELLATRRAAVVDRDPDTLADVVARCVRVKAQIVAADPHERTGARAILNYGHTLAHALETVSGHTLRHGEAVAVGLVFAAELAHALGRVDAAEVDRHRSLLRDLGLPTDAPAGITAADVEPLLRRDKKASGGLTFVLRGPQGVERVDDPPASAVARALANVGIVERAAWETLHRGDDPAARRPQSEPAG